MKNLQKWEEAAVEDAGASHTVGTSDCFTSPESSSPTLGTNPSESSEDSTIISKSIRIKGEIAGQEDLTIQGLYAINPPEPSTGQILLGRTPAKRVASDGLKGGFSLPLTLTRVSIYEKAYPQLWHAKTNPKGGA